MALLGDCGWAILIAGQLNCGRSILNLFDYMKATETLGDGHSSAINRSATERPSGYGPLGILGDNDNMIDTLNRSKVT